MALAQKTRVLFFDSFHAQGGCLDAKSSLCYTSSVCPATSHVFTDFSQDVSNVNLKTYTPCASGRSYIHVHATHTDWLCFYCYSTAHVPRDSPWHSVFLSGSQHCRIDQSACSISSIHTSADRLVYNVQIMSQTRLPVHLYTKKSPTPHAYHVLAT